MDLVSMLSPIILCARTKAKRSRRRREQEAYGTRARARAMAIRSKEGGKRRSTAAWRFRRLTCPSVAGLARPVLARGRAEAYAARLRDGGRGGEGAPAAASGAPGCGGGVPSGERRRRRACLLRGARRRGSRLRLLDVCQRQSKKVPLQTPTTLFSTARAVSLLSLGVLTLDTQGCSTVTLVVEQQG